MTFVGQRVIVTGAASPRGIGFASARLFADAGALVAVLDRDGPGAAAAARDLGPGHLGLSCDIAVTDACAAAVEAVVAAFGGLDVLVNNAGILSPERLEAMSPASAARIMDVNAGGTIAMTLAARAALVASRGAIVNVASVAGQRGGGVFGGAHYAASKAAVMGFTRACARELGPLGVRVNAVAPSMVETDIFAGGLTDARRAEIVAGVPLGRLARAEEIAAAILFLASPAASYVTGATLDVNGGSHIH